jgi:hypothetical protein
MELEIFTVCHATTLKDDKFCLDRVFEELELEMLPSRVQFLSVVVRLNFHRREYGRHNFDFSLTSPSGQQIPPHWGGSLGVSSRAELEYARHTREFRMSDAEFKEYGTHKFTLLVDDRVFQIPFIVVKMPETTISDIARSN